MTAGGVYSGLGVVGLVYPETGLIPNLLAAPGWSEIPAVYNAMITAGTKINGHWDAFVIADLPLLEAPSTRIDTIETAIGWAEDNGFTNERSKVMWPQFQTAAGEIYHGSTLWVWRQLLVDAENNGIPAKRLPTKPCRLPASISAKGAPTAGLTSRGPTT